jgi:enamine deaminase RidA (YjgF/YER057c/UK114 family)
VLLRLRQRRAVSSRGAVPETSAAPATDGGRSGRRAARDEALAGDAYAQAKNVLDTIRIALERAGARIEDVLRTVIYITDIGDADLLGRAHSEVFGAVRPASTMVQVSALVRPEMKVEIEAYAVIDTVDWAIRMLFQNVRV